MIAIRSLSIGDLMGQRKLLRWSGFGGTVAILLLVGSAVAPAATAPSQCANNAPCNDNYINSLELNQAGQRLNRTKTLEDIRDTSTATVQNNLFNPCGAASCPPGPV